MTTRLTEQSPPPLGSVTTLVSRFRNLGEVTFGRKSWFSNYGSTVSGTLYLPGWSRPGVGTRETVQWQPIQNEKSK